MRERQTRHRDARGKVERETDKTQRCKGKGRERETDKTQRCKGKG